MEKEGLLEANTNKGASLERQRIKSCVALALDKL